ncbi:hypothetical protein BX600DRAFT_508544 [Xylariales sp. PMI_506]|nr:hypothetical protein BX600DRAFT_508544 [Xylariales sp. PMI_506]
MDRTVSSTTGFSRIGTMDITTRQQPRRLLVTPNPPLSQQWADDKKSGAATGIDEKETGRGRANFFVSHDPELVVDMMDALHAQMVQKRNDTIFVVRGRPNNPYLVIDAPSNALAAKCIATAQTITNEIRLDKVVKTQMGDLATFPITKVQAYEILAQKNYSVVLNMIAQGVDRKFDWAIETIYESPGLKSETAKILTRELRTARISVDSIQDEKWPCLKFPKTCQFLTEFKQVGIKSVFYFFFGNSSYIVEITIHRIWESFMDMANDKAVPTVTFEVAIYGQHWGESRATEIIKSGQGWGQELEILFLDPAIPVTANGYTRVRGFIGIVNAVCEALSVDN